MNDKEIFEQHFKNEGYDPAEIQQFWQEHMTIQKILNKKTL